MEDEYKITDTEPLLIIDSEQIVDVQFTDYQRIPIPERSHSQELLELPIPLENRIAHLVPYVEPHPKLLTAYAIAKRIGAEDDWVVRIAKRIGIETSQDQSNNGPQLYPVFSLELLEEEWQWYQEYSGLDERLSAYAISNFIAKTEKWVRHRANELGVFPEYERANTGHMAYTYPKTLIPQLRHLILIIPPEEDGFTESELSRLTGERQDWIRYRLAKAGIEATERHSSMSGRVFRFYPNRSLEYIRMLSAERKPGGNWMTVGMMADQLGKSENWVINRVKQYENHAEIRQNDRGKSVLHYPPFVFEALKAEADKLANLERRENKMVLVALAKSIGKKPSWVEKRLPFVEYETEDLMSSNGQVYAHYDESLGDALLLLPEDILDRERKRISQERIIAAVNNRLGRTIATSVSVRRLHRDDKTVPHPQTIVESFGSFEIFNERRGISE